MRLYIVSGILLIVPIVDFALAAPVLVQEKRQSCADMADTPEYPITVLEKRGGIGDDIETLFPEINTYLSKPEEPSAAHESSSSAPSEHAHGSAPSEPGHVNHPLPSIPEGWSPAPSPNRAPPNPGSSTESSHELIGMHAPLSSPVFPTWFHPDHADYGLMRAHASQPNLGSSNPGPSTEFGSDHRLVVEEPPPNPMSSKNPDRRSMGADSRLENLQAVSDALKGNAKESRRARDVLNAAQEGVAA